MRASDASAAVEAPRLPIEVVAALIRNVQGQILLVRKRGTTAFMQPGGKREPGEDDLGALARELHEEIGCRMVPGSAVAHGIFDAPAAHEPGRTVRAAIYSIHVTGDIACQAEIAELIWLDPAAPGDTPLAALTRDVVLPLVVEATGNAQAR
ncbi:NUDIX hydrolase [Microvirga brassicacearum]|uniref:8-oxo-dGTP diphosphatase n=1 Tax=Microvirga brassicacearum TaxID=2580413 RepID=A0A5N3P4P0_9HYPH|nr:NUDIX domain-containing protein [Microvirga brassicacearum]KAB0264708.1 NUDIX domain-containing protein [Microvirga brassicacearum]